MNELVQHFFDEEVPRLTTRLAEIEENIEPLAFPDDGQILADLETVLHAGLEACRKLDAEIQHDDELVKSCQSRFREETAPWCDQSWIIHRARSKPSGFPGDYQMLMAIYDGIPISRGLGGYLDRLCLKMTLGRAVNARLQDARGFLREELAQRTEDVSILDIACGPCREYRGGLGQETPNQVHVTCVDSDDHALQYVRRHVATRTPHNVSFDCVNHNAFRLRSADAIIKRFGQQDIIYSVGLADYIPDRLLIPLLRAWRESLNPGGVVYVAFKDTLEYDKVEYQWLMDWHFLQRREEDCLSLLEQAGYDVQELDVSRDETNVIINYLSRSKVPAYHRVDQQTQPAFHAGTRPRINNPVPR